MACFGASCSSAVVNEGPTATDTPLIPGKGYFDRRTGECVGKFVRIERIKPTDMPIHREYIFEKMGPNYTIQKYRAFTTADDVPLMHTLVISAGCSPDYSQDASPPPMAGLGRRGKKTRRNKKARKHKKSRRH
jgi:hypothetical protein